MEFQRGELYHVYNQGNNRQKIFFESKNYLYFEEKLQEMITPHCSLIAYCLMPNHFHLLIQAGSAHGHSLNRRIGYLLSSYTRAMNKAYNRSGSLFRSRTKSKHIDSPKYAEYCFHYIHQNPVRAKLVPEIGVWPHSSFQHYRDGMTNDVTDILCGIELFQFDSPADFVEASAIAVDIDVIQQIWE